jgi:hypothetical protein
MVARSRVANFGAASKKYARVRAPTTLVFPPPSGEISERSTLDDGSSPRVSR